MCILRWSTYQCLCYDAYVNVYVNIYVNVYVNAYVNVGLSVNVYVNIYDILVAKDVFFIFYSVKKYAYFDIIY